MFKVIRSNLFFSQEQRLFEEAAIDKTHTFITEKKINTVVKWLIKCDNKNKCKFISLLYKKMNSSDLVLRLKSLILLHYCIRQTMNTELIDIVMSYQPVASNRNKSKCKTTFPQINEYIKEKVINFYIVYLKKIAMQNQSYSFVKQLSQNTFPALLTKENMMELIGHGFKIINISNYVLTSQEMFNKMGRYHLQNNEIINLFLSLLNDMNYYNSYLKRTVQNISKSNLTAEKQRAQKSLQLIEINSETILENELSEKEAQQTRHMFLYIHQAQKLSDKLYEFYHNRYYYKTMRRLMIFPTFLEISMKQYTYLKNKAKRIDKDLVKMVKISKYQGTDRYKTENNLNTTSFGLKTNNAFNTSVGQIDYELRQVFRRDTRAYQNIKADFTSFQEILESFDKKQSARHEQVVEDT